MPKRAFIEAVRDEIAQNIRDSQGFVDMLTTVREHGYRSLESYNCCPHRVGRIAGPGWLNSSSRHSGLTCAQTNQCTMK